MSMGVYINMEMPTGCSALTLKVWPDDQVEIIDADGEWKTSKAIPVPLHGRLIDADVLMGRIEHDTSLSSTFEKVVRRYIENASTVIQASEEGEK